MLNYKNISAILALILVGGFVAVVIWGIYLLKENTETVIALVGTLSGLATLAVKEFFGAPGPNGGNGHAE